MTYLVPDRSVGHLTHPGYRAGNSDRGDLDAKRRGCGWTDLDVCWTKDRHPINTHWLDLQHDLFGTGRWSLLTWAQCPKKSRDGYRLRDVFDALTHAHSVGLNVELEAKERASVDEWLLVAEHCEHLWGPGWRAHVNVKCLTTLAGWSQILHDAHAAGFPTLVLARGAWRTRRIDKPWITYIRGSALAYPHAPKENPVSKTQIYPGADAKTQWFADTHPGTRFDANCGVIHTTEGTDYPGYGGGKSAPNVTAKPDFTAKRLRFRQHFPVDMSSRALQNDAGGVETNRLNVVQVELVGTCDPKHRKSWNGEGKLIAGRDYLYWPDAPDWALLDLGKFLEWCRDEHGVPLESNVEWLRYPDSYGQGNPNRMTFAEWRAFRGWCGHQHVPENDHGDPGNLKFSRILDLLAVLARPTKPAPLPTTRWQRDRSLIAAMRKKYARRPQVLKALNDLLKGAPKR